MIDPIELLARDDKWHLGSGDGTLHAPTAPLWLERPGFWDEATVHRQSFAPLFAVAFLDREGRELVPRPYGRRWTPAELTIEYRLDNDISATEVRTVQPGGVFVSEWRLTSPRTTRIHAIAWTVQDAASVPAESLRFEKVLRFARVVAPAPSNGAARPLALSAELACVGGATSWGAAITEPCDARPDWRLAPFAERWRGDGLPGDLRSDSPSEGRLFAAVHRALQVGDDGVAVAFAMRIAPLGTAPAPTRPLGATGRKGTLGGASRRRWRELLGSAPAFRCSDPYLEACYWYRWYVLWSNTASETSSAATQQLRELRWLADPARARGILRAFVGAQSADGGVPGRLLAGSGAGAFQHADWGGALSALDAVRPDDALLLELYPAFARHAEWLLRTHDPTGTGLIDVGEPTEVWPAATARFVSSRTNGKSAVAAGGIKGVDATTYAYRLFRFLERVADRAGQPADVTRWSGRAERTLTVMRERMWDPERGMFCDLDGAMRRTGVAAATAFLPYATDVATADHLPGLERTLLDPGRFWTPFPVPTLAVSDVRFDAFGAWEGRRRIDPANGRVWTALNVAIVEALARASLAYAPHLRTAAAHLLLRTARMTFRDGDLKQPTAHEHYNPFSGHPAEYQGTSDHADAAVADLILQYAVGIRPHATGITVDPFPLGLDQAEVTGLTVRGKSIAVRLEKDRVRVTVDGATREGVIGQPIQVTL